MSGGRGRHGGQQWLGSPEQETWSEGGFGLLAQCGGGGTALAVWQKSRHSSIKSAACRNKPVVLFLEKVEQVNMLVETGISVNWLFVQVAPLTQPTAKITLSNVSPFISGKFYVRELSRHGPFRLRGAGGSRWRRVPLAQMWQKLNHRGKEK